MNKRVKQLVALATVAVMLAGCGQKSAADIAKEAEEERGKLKTDFSVNLDNIKSSSIRANVSVHDPSILQVDDTYYIYGSHMSAAKSKDLRRWEYVSTIDAGAANGYVEENPVYGKIYQSEDGALRFTGSDDSIIPTDAQGGTRIWAPDVKYSEKAGLYYMYFCTTSSFNASTVCYATSKSPEGPFEWKGNIVYSGLTVDNYKETDVLDYVDEAYVEKHYLTAGGTYNYKEYPNALDPTIFWDKDGRMWMVYGSWSGGIYLLEIDESTGKAIHPKADNGDADVDPYYGKRLLGGGHTSIEAPYILYDKSSDYYYLYISNGGLTRTGGYQVRVYRSKTVDGDYVDMNGKKPEQGSGNPAYFGIKMSGNYMLPSLPQAYMATGHNSAFISSDNKRYVVEHTRFEKRGEVHEPRVHQYFLNEEGWPCMLPYATDGETIEEKGYEKSKIVGEYYVVNQGTKIDANIAEPEKWVFTENGYVLGKEVTGTWEQKDGTYYVHMTFGIDAAEDESSDDENDAKKDEKDSFSGVFCEMNDEAGTKVMTFSAVGKNQSIWGVKYDE